MNKENEIYRGNDCCETVDFEKRETSKRRPSYTSEYSDEAWEVKVALPGVVKPDLKISVENEILEIVGLRRAEHPDDWERLTGDAADRQYVLRLDVGPEVDDSGIEAKLEHGQLAVRLPLKEEAKPKSIPVL